MHVVQCLKTISPPLMFWLFFFFLVVLGCWTQGHVLHSATWATPPAFFHIGYFWDRSCFISGQAWTMFFLFVLLFHSWDDRCVLPNPVIGWDGVSWTFYLVWSQIITILISVSQVARIIGFCYHDQVFTFLKVGE
jgi:hypothetical protein